MEPDRDLRGDDVRASETSPHGGGDLGADDAPVQPSREASPEAQAPVDLRDAEQYAERYAALVLGRELSSCEVIIVRATIESMSWGIALRRSGDRCRTTGPGEVGETPVPAREPAGFLQEAPTLEDPEVEGYMLGMEFRLAEIYYDEAVANLPKPIKYNDETMAEITRMIKDAVEEGDQNG